MKMLDDLRNLDQNNRGAWPNSIKWLCCAVIVGVILLVGWYFKVDAQQEDLARAQSTEQGLRKEFADKQAKVINLEPLKIQLAKMQDMLRQLLRQLPSKTEMPQLLVDISQTALAAGLQVDLFKPGPEQMKEFYAEKPIEIHMAGTYHQFGTFISGVASLPRVVILTMHDVVLRPQDKAQAGGAPTSNRLVMQGVVKTYRYLEDEEVAEIAAQEAAAKEGR